jgi:hypothetical protein
MERVEFAAHASVVITQGRVKAFQRRTYLLRLMQSGTGGFVAAVHSVQTEHHHVSGTPEHAQGGVMPMMDGIAAADCLVCLLHPALTPHGEDVLYRKRVFHDYDAKVVLFFQLSKDSGIYFIRRSRQPYTRRSPSEFTPKKKRYKNNRAGICIKGNFVLSLPRIPIAPASGKATCPKTETPR